MKKTEIIVIGSGFAGLAAAALTAKAGHRVSLIEKNDQPGGRARVWKQDGFRFDMGPSWYWMPDVFEDFYTTFGKDANDFYELKRLDPAYRIYFGKDDFIDVPADREELRALFETQEPGSAKQLDLFLEQAKYKYEVGMKDYAMRPSHSFLEFFDFNLIKQSFKIDLFSGMSRHVRQHFKNRRLIKLLEFPVLFLGATPQKTPALYSMMNYADLSLGTWYPMGGMNEIVKAMTAISIEQGVEIHFETEAKQIRVENGSATGVETNRAFFPADLIISNADYQYTDQVLTPKSNRNYSSEYWSSRTLSPSCLIFYVGLNKRLDKVLHHNLFFDEDFLLHAEEIYKSPKWPSKPLFYVCCPSKTDSSVAPPDCENLFFLVPIAPGLKDSEEQRDIYFDFILDRFEKITGQNIKENIVFKRSYCVNDFINDYHSYKGNAYGLANTLMQTAFLKPKMRSKKVKNLFFTGQLTVPGPGVPPAIISGMIAAKEALKTLKG